MSNWRKLDSVPVKSLAVVAAVMAEATRRRAAIDALLAAILPHCTADRSIYSRVNPYPILDYRQLHLPELSPLKTLDTLQGDLIAAGYERTEHDNYFERAAWQRGF
jgi:hypothetical protein